MLSLSGNFDDWLDVCVSTDWRHCLSWKKIDDDMYEAAIVVRPPNLNNVSIVARLSDSFSDFSAVTEAKGKVFSIILEIASSSLKDPQFNREIAALLVHEVGHCYDVAFRKKSIDSFYSPTVSAHPFQYYFHDLEFSQQIWTGAFVLLNSDPKLLARILLNASTEFENDNAEFFELLGKFDSKEKIWLLIFKANVIEYVFNSEFASSGLFGKIRRALGYWMTTTRRRLFPSTEMSNILTLKQKQRDGTLTDQERETKNSLYFNWRYRHSSTKTVEHRLPHSLPVRLRRVKIFCALLLRAHKRLRKIQETKLTYI